VTGWFTSPTGSQFFWLILLVLLAWICASSAPRHPAAATPPPRLPAAHCAWMDDDMDNGVCETGSVPPDASYASGVRMTAALRFGSWFFFSVAGLRSRFRAAWAGSSAASGVAVLYPACYRRHLPLLALCFPCSRFFLLRHVIFSQTWHATTSLCRYRGESPITWRLSNYVRCSMGWFCLLPWQQQHSGERDLLKTWFPTHNSQ